MGWRSFRVLVLAYPYLRNIVRVVELLPRATAHGFARSSGGRGPSDLGNTGARAGSRGVRTRGSDIFAPRGTPVTAATQGVVRKGWNRPGGKTVSVMGPAAVPLLRHRTSGTSGAGELGGAGTVLGYVGDTGNAKGTPPHLH